MRFHLPGAAHDVEAERLYFELVPAAEWRAEPAAARNERVRSVTFKHDRETVTATVGHAISREREIPRRQQGRRYKQPITRSDPTIPIAIYRMTAEPAKFVVVTDGGGPWNNPFITTAVQSIELFDS